MAPKTRSGDENSKGEKIVAANEAFPYDLLEIQGNQQSHYRATKTITEKRRQRAKRANIVMTKLREVIA